MRPLLIILGSILALYLVKVFILDKENTPPPTNATTTSPKKAAGLKVDIYVAKEVSSANTVFATGTIVANEEVEIRSEVSGRLVDLNIQEGAYVKKGQRLAKLNDEDLVAQLKKLKYEEEFARQTEVRQKKLLDIDAISKEEYEMAVNRINTLSADKEYLEVQLEKTSVLAPFSGRLGLKNISEGAYLTPNDVIVNLVQTNPAKLDFSVPEKYANEIKVGQSVQFSIDGSTEKGMAKIIALDPQIDEDLRTLRVRAQTNNSGGTLLPGMFIRVEVPLGNKNSIMIPSEAIIPILKGKKVFVMEGGKAQERIIKTGLRTDTRVSVEEGLALGDSVVVSALMSVKANTPILLRNLIP